MTLFSAVLALTLSSAHARSSSTPYKHGAVTITVNMEDGGWRPDSVFYNGPKGQWFITDAELYDLGKDEPEVQVRHDIYNFRKEGLEYLADSSVRAPHVTRWDEPGIIGAIENIVHRLDGVKEGGKQEAGTECLAQADKWQRRQRSAEARRKSFETGERLLPGYVKDTKELAALEPKLADAANKLDGAKRSCDYAIAMLDERKNQGFWLASLDRRKAIEVVTQSENVLDWLPTPIR